MTSEPSLNPNQQNIQPEPPFNQKNEKADAIGGGLPVIEYWAGLCRKNGRVEGFNIL